MGHRPETLSRLVWMSRREMLCTVVCGKLGSIFCTYSEPGVKLHQFKVDSHTLSHTLSHDASHFVVPVSNFPRAASSYHGFSEPCCSPFGTRTLPFSDPYVYPPPRTRIKGILGHFMISQNGRFQVFRVSSFLDDCFICVDQGRIASNEKTVHQYSK
jgi:hypothetical protein